MRVPLRSAACGRARTPYGDRDQTLTTLTRAVYVCGYVGFLGCEGFGKASPTLTNPHAGEGQGGRPRGGGEGDRTAGRRREDQRAEVGSSRSGPSSETGSGGALRHGVGDLEPVDRMAHGSTPTHAIKRLTRARKRSMRAWINADPWIRLRPLKRESTARKTILHGSLTHHRRKYVASNRSSGITLAWPASITFTM